MRSSRKKASPALPPLSHKDWQGQVLELAGLLGYRAYHTFDSRKSAEGFPDLVLASSRRKLVFFLELKVWPDVPTPEQTAWIKELKGAGQLAFVFYPEDFEELKALLMSEGP